MYVPSYQMHNVLNVYSKKLRRSISSKNKNISEALPVDRVDLTSEAKRRTTIEKVSKEILDKIIRFGSKTDTPHGSSEHRKTSNDKVSASAKPNRVGFVFNVIDTINNKTTNTISVEDSSFLIQRLEQLSKDAIGIKLDIGFEDQGKIDNPII
jgi:hypothetical protein